MQMATSGPGIGTNAKPLLSWRVAILPWIEQDALYKQFHLNEPWDSEHNKKLLAQMPAVYAAPGLKDREGGRTYYQAVVGTGAAFEPRRQLRLPDFLDGTSNTLCIAEAAVPVPWTKPEDLPFDPNGPLPPLGRQSSAGFNVALADGSTRWLPNQTPERTLRLLITRNDGQMVPNLP